jgi:hypothetical protein
MVLDHFSHKSKTIVVARRQVFHILAGLFGAFAKRRTQTSSANISVATFFLFAAINLKVFIFVDSSYFLQ